MSTPDPADVAAAKVALDGVRREWLRREEVVSVEVARARRPDVPGGVCLRVTVATGSGGSGFPTEVDGVPVEIVEGTGPGLE